MSSIDDFFAAVLDGDDDEPTPAELFANEQRDARIAAMVRADLERVEALELSKRKQSERDLSARGPLVGRILDYQALRALPLPTPLVHDVLYTGSVAVVLGDSQTGKTWVMLSIAAAAASGLRWPVVTYEPAPVLPVLYVAAEDGGSIGARLGCWERAHHRDLTSAPLHTHASSINILDPVEIEELCRVVAARGYRMVIIDTVSATFGGEEEGNAEFSRIVRHCRQVTAAMVAAGGGSVVLVHHFGKDKSKGGRGGSSLFNDADIVWELGGSIDNISMVCKKWKSDSIRKPFALFLDRTDSNAVHLAISDHSGATMNAADPRDKYALLAQTIMKICTEFAHKYQGYGPSQSDIVGQLQEMGSAARKQVVVDQLASMSLDGRLLVHSGTRGAKHYRPAPIQDTLT